MTHLRRAAALLAGLLLMWLALRGTSWTETWRVMRTADPLLLCAAIAATLVATWLRAWRWHRLFAPYQRGAGTMALWRIVLVGQTLNIAVPARLGEVARIYLAAEAAGRPKVHVAATIAMEKLLDAAAFLALASVVSLLVALPAWLARARDAFAIAVAIVLTVTFVIVGSSERALALLERLPLPRWVSSRLGTSALRPAAEALQQLRSASAVWVLTLQSVLIWSAATLPNYFVLRALDIRAPWLAAVVLLLVLQLGTAPPSTPGKLGVFQYLCVLGLAAFAVDREHAVGYGILLHMVAYLPPLTIGTALIVAWLPRLRRSGVLAEGKAGFTRAQLLIALAMIFVCALVVPPSIALVVNARRIAKATEDVGRIAVAIERATRDLGSQPRWIRQADRASQRSGERVAILFGPGEAPKVAEGSGDWPSGPFDTLTRQLVSNGPDYTASDWRGPYLVPDAGADPWGNRYMAAFEGEGFVVSAGPNGTIDTPLDALGAGSRQGDDIVSLVRRQ